jgi:nucleotide-binding universal stress UspA family protein
MLYRRGFPVFTKVKIRVGSVKIVQMCVTTMCTTLRPFRFLTLYAAPAAEWTRASVSPDALDGRLCGKVTVRGLFLASSTIVVTLVPGMRRAPLKTLMVKYSLVGYDGSPASRRALDFAVDLARLGGGRVRVVSVLQVAEGGVDACTLMMADSGSRRVQELHDELTEIVPDAQTLLDIELIHGSPGDVLLGQIDQHGVDHIVIGHTERGALARWLMGSVSGNVLARAHVPVTVVR